MERNWRDFKALNGNIAGARTSFETTCEALFRKIHSDKHVQQVEVKVGDGGIDIFVGEIGISPITVIQCKFFLEEFGEIQYNQIRNSFKKAKESDQYILKDWILCLPIVLDIDQNKWWCDWKEKKTQEYSLNDNFIKLYNGNHLISLLKDNNLYNSCFQIEDSLLIKNTNDKITEIHNALTKQKTTEDNGNLDFAHKILFNNYTPDCEQFYFERPIDTTFVTHINVSNIWIYGPSGTGKTALINRNILKSNINYLYCDYSPIDINIVEDIFSELKFSICEKYDVACDTLQSNKVKEISAILCNPKVPSNISIILDELSFPDNEVEKNFAESLTQLATYYSKQTPNKNLKFVISTIPEPLKIIKNKEKASEHFKYIIANNWNEEIGELLNLIVASLKIKLSENSTTAVRIAANNNPRLLKNILRKINILPTIDDESVKGCITEATNEYF